MVLVFFATKFRNRKFRGSFRTDVLKGKRFLSAIPKVHYPESPLFRTYQGCRKEF